MILYVCVCVRACVLTQLCAADVVYSSTALMEDVEVPYSDAFFTALDALSMR